VKVGDTVRLVGDYTISQAWVIINIKSNSKGLWIQVKDDCKVPDVWHKADNYEVIIEKTD